MYKIQKPKKTSSTKKLIPPGVYMAIVTSVAWSKGYYEGNAIDVHYDVETIKDDKPHIVAYKECFFVKGTSPRTARLHQLLDEIGADNYDDIVGHKLNLVFAYEVKETGRFCNVVDHSFVKGGETDAVTSIESQAV